jgi:flagellar biosynthesis protein FlhF
MKLRKFVAPTLKEATEAMKEELGDSAIILHTKRNQATEDEEETYEITVGVDNNPYEINEKVIDRNKISDLATLDNLKKIAEKFQNAREEKSLENKVTVAPKTSDDLTSLKHELDSVKDTLGEIADRLKSERLPEMPKQLRDVFALLIKNEVNEGIAKSLIFEISGMMTFFENVEYDVVLNILHKKIAERIITAPPVKISDNKSKIITFVGATGVGKTTTICKIAAICKYFNHYDVAIISVDTYRLAAIDQLKIFTEIANIPLEIAYSTDELNNMINKHHDKQIIFIDTVGRSPKKEEDIKEIKNFIQSTSSHEVHLILSATTSLSAMKETVKQFGQVMPNRLIISKIDEAVNYGNILNIIDYTQLPLSYFTTGQVIPDDIDAVDKNKIATLIIKSKSNGDDDFLEPNAFEPESSF